MNQLNNMLKSIRIQKTLYQKQLDTTKDCNEQLQLKLKIEKLSLEEKKILKQLGVELCK